jgi:hypothetical protein
MYNYMRLSSEGDVAVEMLERAQDCVICMQPFDVSGSEATAITPCNHVRYGQYVRGFVQLIFVLFAGVSRVVFAAGFAP